jgi:tetratricopeptide (TPR) repeat protein
MLMHELIRHQTVIQPISVPQPMTEAGISPEIAARRLQDALNRIAEEAATISDKGLAVSMSADAPEIVVPTVGISMSTVATYLQHFFGWSPRTIISGEFTGSGEHLTLLLRLDGEEIFRSRNAIPLDDLDKVWPQAAEAAMLEISPYRAMLAWYGTDHESALDLANKFVARYPRFDENYAWARILLGIGSLDSRHYGEAEKDFREVLSLDGESSRLPTWAPSWLPTWAFSWLPTWASPTTRSPYEETARAYLGATLLSLGNPAGARDELEKAIDLDPTDPGANYYLGVALRDLKQPQDAAVEFETANSIYRILLHKPQGHGPGSAPIHAAFGQILLDENRHVEAALGQLSWAVELDPTSSEAHLAFCAGWQQAPAWAHQKNLNDRALAECRLAAKLAPQPAPAQTYLALELIELGDLYGAQEAAEEAVGFAHASPGARNVLGQVYEHRSAEYQVADWDRDRALGEYRNGALGSYWRSAAVEYRNKASAEYQEAVRLAPEVAEYRISVASILMDYDLNRAQEAAEEAVRLASNSPDAHDMLCQTYEKSSDLEKAMAECQEAVRLAPDVAAYRNEIGNILYEKGNYATAAVAYWEAGILNPLDNTIQENLASATHELALWVKAGNPMANPQ